MNKKLISLLIALSMVASHGVVFAQADTAATAAAEVAVEETVAVEEAATEEVAAEEEAVTEESSVTREVTSSENFNEGIKNWEALSGKGFKEKGSALYFKNKQTSETNNILMSKSLSIKNADLEFDMKLASGSVYAGVMFRAESDKTMYQVRFYKNEGKAVLLKRVNSGEVVELKRTSAKIKSDEYSKVGIRLVDNKISVRVDGRALFTDIKDKSLESGKIGFDMYCAEATIDNVEIVKYSNVEYDKVEIDPEDANKVANYYVAPTGSSGDGTKESPFVGVEEAKKAAAKAKRTGKTANVIFLEGTYELKAPLKFTAGDSGTENSPITYKADEGAKVVFTGASEIDHSKATPVKGKMENRIHQNAKGKIVQIKLSTDTFPQELIDFTEPTWNNAKGVGERLKPPMIFINDQQQEIAKWPNDEYRIIEACDPGAAANVGGDLNNGGAITYSDVDPNNWTQAERLFLEGWFGNFWTAEWAPVKKVNVEKNKIELKYRTAYGILSKHRWGAVNLIEELDIPGEYYIDREEKMLYLYPTHTLTAKDKITVAKPMNLIETQGAQYINFEGIDFTMAGAIPSDYNISSRSGCAISIDKESKNITVKNSNITNVANAALYIQGYNHMIDGCVIYNSGVDGISIDNVGDKKNLIPSGVVIQNSIISDVTFNTGRNAYAGIRVGTNTCDVHIRNNIMHNIINNAIRYRGVGHQFYHNEFSSVTTSTADAGALYTGRAWSDWGCSA
ncbi:MAG: DUF1080 domain-containing protein, partial [Clostridia bacterium]|nr:DUF1080 domain-containing protein [Clostridia bacterium]